MIDTLKSISDTVSTLSHPIAKDTIYIVNVGNESDLIKLLPILIALVALIFTAISIWISKQALTANLTHQKLSVRPLLTTKEEFSLSNKEGIGIILISCGLGPAIIKDFNMAWDGAIITKDNYEMITGALGISQINVQTFTADAIIEKDSSNWLIRIPLTEFKTNTIYNSVVVDKILETFRENFTFKIVYTSIYWDEDSDITLKYPFNKTQKENKKLL